MKFFNPTSLILLCLIVCSKIHAQEFLPGYYISVNNDTVRGNFSSPSKSGAAAFSFKQQMADEHIVSVDFNQCTALLAGKYFYINWYGKRHVSYVHKIEKTVINDSLGITGHIPLKLLFKGNKLCLYYFEDETEHYFAALQDSVQELIVM